MCSEVMYGAYYPYLYGRAGPSRPFYQYDRFNQDLYPSAAGVPIAASTSTSASSHSPCSPLLPSALSSSSSNSVAHSSALTPSIPLAGSLGHQRNVAKEEDLTVPRNETEATLPGNHNDSSSCSSGPESPNGDGRTQYVSATCVVVTHYSGDVANVVDEHFTRALNFNNDKTSKEANPMSARNFPASFWNSNYVPPTPIPTHHHQMSDLYSTESSLYSTEPWVHPGAYNSYAAHAYHHNMAQYGSLLRLPQQYAAHGHSSRLHHDQQTAHALESAAAAYSNYPMSGLEAQVQESSKDLYWF